MKYGISYGESFQFLCFSVIHCHVK